MLLSNDLEAIGSAPLYYDSSTFTTAMSYLKDFDLLKDIPQRVKDYFLLGVLGKIEDTPKSEKE